MLKNAMRSAQYGEDEVCIDVKYDMAERIEERQAETTDRVVRDATEARGTTQDDDQDEPLAPSPTKATSTNYATDDKRSRIDDWRSRPQSRGDRRSENRSGYSRTASRGKHLHDLPKYGGRSSSRQTLSPDRGGNRIRNRSRGRSPANGTKERERERERSADKPKSDRTEKVEGLEEENAMMSAKYEEDGIFIDVKHDQAASLVAKEKDLNTKLRKQTEKAPETRQIDEKNEGPAPSINFELEWKVKEIKDSIGGIPRIDKNPDTEPKEQKEKAPETRQTDERNKRSLPLASFELEGKKEMDMKGNEKENPEAIAPLAAEIPTKEQKRPDWLVVEKDVECKKRNVEPGKEDMKVFLVAGKKKTGPSKAAGKIQERYNKSGNQMLRALRKIGKLRTETEKRREKTSDTGQTEKKKKRSPPAVSFEPERRKEDEAVLLVAEEMEAKDDEQENPEEIVEVLEKPVATIETEGEKPTTGVESVPHTKPGVKEWSEEGKLGPEYIEPEDEWDRLRADLRKVTAKTEKVEIRIQESQRKLSTLKHKKEDRELIIDAPTAEVAVDEVQGLAGEMPPKEKKGSKAAEAKEREQKSSLDTIMEEKNNPPDKIRRNGENSYGSNEDPQKWTRQRKWQPNLRMIREKKLSNLMDRFRGEEKSLEPPQKEEKKAPRKNGKELSRLAANSGPNSAKRQKGLKNPKDINRRMTRGRNKKDRVTSKKIKEKGDTILGGEETREGAIRGGEDTCKCCGESNKSNEGPQKHTRRGKPVVRKDSNAEFANERSWLTHGKKDHKKEPPDDDNRKGDYEKKESPRLLKETKQQKSATKKRKKRLLFEEEECRSTRMMSGDITRMIGGDDTKTNRNGIKGGEDDGQITSTKTSINEERSNEEDPQKDTSLGKRQLEPFTDRNDDKSGGNVGAKQQAETKSKEEKMTGNSIGGENTRRIGGDDTRKGRNKIKRGEDGGRMIPTQV